MISLAAGFDGALRDELRVRRDGSDDPRADHAVGQHEREDARDAGQADDVRPRRKSRGVITGAV
jgi:hypothetical protein